jgi:hypothetical protein
MPNWCNNTVEISHPDTAKVYELVEAINAGKFCNYAIPVPESLNIVAGSVGDPDQQKKLEEDTARNIEKHGYGNWYDYCVARWGTKWDVDAYETVEYDDQHDGNSITFGFDSAWSPPTGVYEALVEQGFSVKAYYYESGMGFAGVWNNGDDDYIEYAGMTADELEKEIDPELDEVMCITENMRMWEEENAEEENLEIDLDGGLSATNE